MEERFDEKHELAFTQKDIISPLKWIENLSLHSLREWLRLAVWVRNPLPVTVPHTSRLAVEISDLLKKGSSDLKTRVRTVIPGLLQEWGRDDPSSSLDDLLIICGRLRCAAAEPAIALIATERLRGRKEEISLRQRCLSVLSGFGCTERTVYVFKQYINDIEYAAICYRALYRFDLSYAATELPALLEVYREADAIDELNFALGTLFRDHPKSSQRIEILTLYLKLAEPESFADVLQTLVSIEALTIDFLLEARSSQRIEVFRLLLKRSQPENLRDILWRLKSIGIELHSVKSKNDREYIEGVYEDSDSVMSESERIIFTGELSDEVVTAIIESNEEVAVAWAATATGKW